VKLSPPNYKEAVSRVTVPPCLTLLPTNPRAGRAGVERSFSARLNLSPTMQRGVHLIWALALPMAVFHVMLLPFMMLRRLHKTERLIRTPSAWRVWVRLAS